MSKNSSSGGVARFGLAALTVCVLWWFVTGALWQFLPAALAVYVGALAAQAAGTKGK